MTAIRSLAALAALAASVALAVPAFGQTGTGKPASRPATSRPAASPGADADPNPALPGFDAEGSDRKAIKIADRVMAAMGGRAAWDDTRHLTWNFFGSRTHHWDKKTGNIRIEGRRRTSDEPYVILMNIHSRQGSVWLDGVEASPADRDELLEGGYESWVNDSYWLVMPYKLKDSGVTLTYLGDEQKMADGRGAWLLRLRFKDVGITPDNEYHVYVAKDTGLIEQWDFYRSRGSEKPLFSTPWHGWKRYGSIMLASDRGEMRGNRAELTGIAVYKTLPDSVYTSPEPVIHGPKAAPGAGTSGSEGVR